MVYDEYLLVQESLSYVRSVWINVSKNDEAFYGLYIPTEKILFWFDLKRIENVRCFRNNGFFLVLEMKL